MRRQPGAGMYLLAARCTPHSALVIPRVVGTRASQRARCLHSEGDSAPLSSSSSEGAGAPPAQLQTSTPRFSMSQFKILKEDLVYSRYIRVFNRVVEQPKGQHAIQQGDASGAESSHVVEYDVVGSRTKDCHFVCVFPFHSATKTVTLIREYAQGANAMVYTVPCGGFAESHGTVEECARRELSEEAHLCGGSLVRLLDESHPGLLEVKWCKNRFTPFLVIDPQPDLSPHAQDAEEVIETLQVEIPRLKQMMYSGDMMLPSIATCSMALDHLQTKGLL